MSCAFSSIELLNLVLHGKKELTTFTAGYVFVYTCKKDLGIKFLFIKIYNNHNFPVH